MCAGPVNREDLAAMACPQVPFAPRQTSTNASFSRSSQIVTKYVAVAAGANILCMTSRGKHQWPIGYVRKRTVEECQMKLDISQLRALIVAREPREFRVGYRPSQIGHWSPCWSPL